MPPSQAWIAYDAQALYIAMRHPVNNAGALLPSSHQWGDVDGVEVAFQNAFAAKPGAILTLYGYPDGKFTSEDFGGATAAEIAKLEKAVTYKAAVGDKEWTCEWRIPFSASGFSAADRAAVGLQPRRAQALARGLGGLARNRRRRPTRWATAGCWSSRAEILAQPLPTDKLEVHLDAQAAEYGDR